MDAVRVQLFIAIQEGDSESVADIMKTHHENIQSILHSGDSTGKFYFLHEACKQGYETIVLTLVAYHRDINENSPEGTPLYIACKYGYYNIVDLLLCNGATAPRPQEGVLECPYYVTSYNGWVDILLLLHEARPDLSSDLFVLRWCLQAAISGGHLDITKVCYERFKEQHTQEEIRRYLQDFIILACQDERDSVIRYLITCGAQLTVDVIERFPKIFPRVFAQYVNVISSDDDWDDRNEHRFVASWSSKNLHEVRISWLLTYMDRLTVLDLSHNNLTALPEQLPWQMPSLGTLDVSHNRLTALPTPCLVLGTSLKILRASHNQLTAVPRELFDIVSLEQLDLSYNSISSFSIQYPRLTYCEKKQTMQGQHFLRESRNLFHQMSLPLQKKTSSKDCDVPRSLQQLNVSGNCLIHPPLQLHLFERLVVLRAAHNRLKSFVSAWNCPLEILDLSDNELTSLPEDWHLYWSHSLTKLFLQENQLTSLPETVCRLEKLKILDVSRNMLSSLPEASCWRCSQLEELVLSHNMLKCNTESRRKFLFYTETEPVKNIEFPVVFVGDLMELDLSYNQLKSVPPSVCKLVNLRQLLLNGNPDIQVLPPELSALEECYQLGLSETNIKNIPDHLLKAPIRTRSIMAHLKHLLRKSVPYNSMKLMITGKPGQGKSSLVKQLVDKQNINPDENKAVNIIDWSVSGSAMRRKLKIKNSKAEDFPDVTFQIWDLDGRNDPYLTHKLFLSPCTLCIVVFDLRLQKEGVQSLHSWLLDIEAHAAKSHVIIVGTFLDCLNEAGRLKVNQLRAELCSVCKKCNGYPQIDFITEVSCKTKEGIDKLREIIYVVATGMTFANRFSSMTSRHLDDRVVGRKVPKSYLDLGKALMTEASLQRIKEKVPILNTKQVLEIAESLPQNDIKTPEELLIATQFLHEAGYILHYSSTLRGLNELYFLDPAWLADSLLKLINIPPNYGCLSEGILDLVKVQQLLFTEEIQKSASLDQYVDLLEKFEIALLMDRQRLFLPSKLINKKPTSVAKLLQREDYFKLHRVYCMKYTPNGFWPRLIIQIIIMVQRICKQVELPIKLGVPNKPTEESEWDRRRAMYSSLCLANCKVKVIYWQQGILLDYGQGVLLVESNDQTTSNWKNSCPGIMVTVAAKTKDQFSLLGFAIDQIEHIISQWFTGLLDDSNPIERFIPCANCINKVSHLKTTVHMFDIQQCIASFLSGKDTSISCPNCGLCNMPAEELIPDFTLSDLPRELHISEEALITDEEPKKLGQGGEGLVYQARFMNSCVAVKQNGVMFSKDIDILTQSISDRTVFSDTSVSQADLSTDSHMTASSDTSSSFVGTKKLHFLFKLLPALQEYRREVMLLNRLKHPCVITLMAVLPRQLTYVMELAPLGCLHTVTQNLYNEQLETNNRTHFNMLMDRMLTCKIVYQIVSALQYLHNIMVVYKDLKPQNVLVWSLNPECPINVKLSDYGLSCYLTPQGIRGIEGTVGYQAPETRKGNSYNEKVDIFALGMVIYQVLTGVQVFSNLPSVIIPKTIQEGIRPSLEQVNVHPDLPCMVAMMENCWQNDPADRPPAQELASQIRDPSFWMLRHIVPKRLREVIAVHNDPDQPGDSSLYCVTAPRDPQGPHSLCLINVLQGRVIYERDLCHLRVLSLCCIDHVIVVGTQSHELHIYFLGRAKFQQQEVCPPVCTDDDPLTILYRDCEDAQNADGCHKEIFVSLANGSVCKYHLKLHDNSDTALKLETSHSLDGSAPIKSMMFMENKTRIWLGSGPNIVIIECDDLTEVGRIAVFPDEVTHDRPILGLCCHGDQVWCFQRRSWSAIEIDVSSLNRVCWFDSSLGLAVGDLAIVWDHSSAETGRQSKCTGAHTLSPRLSRRRPSRLSGKHKRKTVIEESKRPTTQTLQRKLSIYRQNCSRHKPVNKHRQPFYQISSLCYASGALWIGRKCGDILMINVCRNNTYNYKYGQVIAVLQNGYLPGRGSGAIRSLVPFKDRVTAVRELLSDRTRDKTTEILVWSAADLEQIHRAQKYWSLEFNEQATLA